MPMKIPSEPSAIICEGKRTFFAYFMHNLFLSVLIFLSYLCARKTGLA